MGDRANVVIKEDEEEVVLYTHWEGHELPTIVRKALVRGEDRWNDNQYLARIIFGEMIQGDVLGLTGYGITDTVHDGENQVIIVDVGKQTVSVNGRSCTFAEYVVNDLGWEQDGWTEDRMTREG